PGIALHDASHDLTFLGGEFAEGALVLGVAQALQDDLASCGGRDPAEPLGGVVPLLEDIAGVVELLRQHPDQAGLPVDVDTGVRLVAIGMLVGGEQRRLDGLEHRLERDVLVPLYGTQRGDVDVHRSSQSCPCPPSSAASSAAGGGRNSTSTTARRSSVYSTRRR